MPYDQKKVLESNKLYILKSLELDAIEFFYVDGGVVIDGGDAKKIEAAAPGKPSIYLYSVDV
jgi:hypothetical protein